MYLIHTAVHACEVTNWRLFVEISTNMSIAKLGPPWSWQVALATGSSTPCMNPIATVRGRHMVTGAALWMAVVWHNMVATAACG